MKRYFLLPLLALPFLFSLEGCGGGSSTPAPASLDRSVTLQTVSDPWALARPRWLDVADRPFSNTFVNSFSYSNARVSFAYDGAPKNSFWSGKISASGLKPNFAYQIKLVGKPVHGTRGWGTNGDDFSNEALGRVGRWWNDSDPAANTNNSDEVFERLYKNPVPAQKQTVYGYLFLGVFLTDGNGRANTTFIGDKSYHITWKENQNGPKDVFAGDFTLTSNAPFLGYGSAAGSQPIKLWYELEAGRAQPIRLPKGRYNCRILLTEETFHNFDLSGKGGFWPTVLGSEEFADSSSANDVRFEIG